MLDAVEIKLLGLSFEKKKMLGAQEIKSKTDFFSSTPSETVLIKDRFPKNLVLTKRATFSVSINKTSDTIIK